MRYHFHDRNGQSHHDRDGTDLATVDDAKAMGVKLLASLIADDPESFWNHGDHVVVCTDNSGLTLYEICAVVTKASLSR